jgi:two-component system sensor histidine kinase AdeS
MTVLACVVFLFIYRGSYLLDDHFYQPIINGLPPKARAAYDAINSFRMPDPEDFKSLAAVWRERVEPFRRQQAIDLYALFGVSCILLAGTAYLFAMRLASPIERIAAGVRQLASGDLAVRISNERVWGLEAQSLVHDFNRLAESLVASQRTLRESNAAIAHELRTPLTVLRGRIQGMRDGVFGRSPAELDRLLLQIDALTRIVEDLRVLSLASASALTVHSAALDLATEAEAVLDVVAPDLDAMGMALERDLRPAPMLGDGSRLRQAILALVDNSRRYAESGGILRLETGLSGHQVFLRILDRGPGFPEGTDEQAFEPFWRAEASRSRAAGGSGLGLAVVKAIVDAHGGAVTIARNSPTGAKIELRFESDQASATLLLRRLT